MVTAENLGLDIGATLKFINRCDCQQKLNGHSYSVKDQKHTI